MGYNNFMSRLGVSMAPLILLLEDVWTPLPQIIICSVAIISGLVTLLLPETRGAILPESINDIEKPRWVNLILKPACPNNKLIVSDATILLFFLYFREKEVSSVQTEESSSVFLLSNSTTHSGVREKSKDSH